MQLMCEIYRVSCYRPTLFKYSIVEPSLVFLCYTSMLALLPLTSMLKLNADISMMVEYQWNYSQNVRV